MACYYSAFLSSFWDTPLQLPFRGKKKEKHPKKKSSNFPCGGPHYIIGGLAGLIIGGNFFVDGAAGIARSLGVSESVIGLTLVAGGTSLPELATSIVAALKKNPEIAIGNVIGSNLFNIFFVLGCSASITPLHLAGITNLDLLVLVGSSILLWFFGLFFAKRTITRIEGSILILCYIAYTVVLIYNV